MARFYRVQIGPVYLTDTGLIGGIPCKLKIPGIEALRVTYAGETAPSAGGTPHTVAFSVGTKGRPLSIEIESLPKAVFDSIVTLINNALANNTTITLIGTGDYGDFNLAAVPRLPSPITGSSEFINGRLKKVSFHFTTAS
jgi:hypothetical protein